MENENNLRNNEKFEKVTLTLEDERRKKCSCLISPINTLGLKSLTSVDEECHSSFAYTVTIRFDEFERNK